MLEYLFLFLRNNMCCGYIFAAGRNSSGVICVRHRSSSVQTKLLYIDHMRRLNLFGYVFKIIKILNYTGFIALVIYQNGLSSYILLADSLQVGICLFSGSVLIDDKEHICLGRGSSIACTFIPLFSLIHNIEPVSCRGGTIARAAGTSGLIITKTLDKIIIKLKSGWNLAVGTNNIISLGLVSNVEHRFSKIGKAGLNRKFGIRPTVRGVAMNPCDHPHGGGEGKASPPAAQRSP